MQYVLIENVASPRNGAPLYFCRMTAIGPMTTPELADAPKYASVQAAWGSPAYAHLLSSWDVVELGVLEQYAAKLAAGIPG